MAISSSVIVLRITARVPLEPILAVMGCSSIDNLRLEIRKKHIIYWKHSTLRLLLLHLPQNSLFYIPAPQYQLPLCS